MPTSSRTTFSTVFLTIVIRVDILVITAIGLGVMFGFV